MSQSNTETAIGALLGTQGQTAAPIGSPPNRHGRRVGKRLDQSQEPPPPTWPISALLEGLIDRERLKQELGGISTRTVIRMEAQGLPVIRRGHLRFYDVDAVRAWLRGERRRGGRRNAAA